MKRIIKKIIKIILILMLIVSVMSACTYKAYAASAAGVVVAGGSIGTGGAAAGLLGLMGPVTAILGVALAAYGISVVLDQSAEAEGVTKTEFLYEKVTEYNEQRNLSNQAMQDLILDGASVLKNGAISISNKASAYIKGFINYLFGSGEIQSPGGIAAGSYVTLGGIELPVLPVGETFFLANNYPQFSINNNISGRVIVGYQYNWYIHFLSNKGDILQTSVRYMNMREIMPGLFTNSSDVLYSSGCTFPNVAEVYTGHDRFLAAITSEEIAALSNPNSGSESAASSLVGDQDVFNDRAGTLSPSNDENTVFYPPLVGSLPGTGSVSISDYLDTIIDLLNEGEADIPIADPVTDVVSSVAVTDVDLSDTVPSVDTVEEQDEVGSTAVVDPDAPLNPDIDTINSLAFDLREIFPFCIPFDLYNLLSKFVAEPEAPHWQISIPLPLNLPALEFEIDLSGFESAAVVLRSFEMVVFVASLAVATRSIYLRG